MSPDTGASVELVAVVAVSSALALLLGRRLLRLPLRGLRFAWGRALECVGLAVVFYGLNVGLGLAGALIARAAGSDVSLYTSGDASLAVFSLLQALVLEWWRTARE
ncbi:MAG TPA: hypothetical protein VGQ78_08085 [Vicinamibacteria bacterium]|nr:hypothetical protein [Vicinamibacteria bacterium]